MEKRQDKRYKTRQIVKVCGKLGVINDISDSGIQISTSYSPKNRKINIVLESNGGAIDLNGIIQWVKWKQQLQSLNEMGIMIKNAPPEYLTFLKNTTTA
jgi:hypothetical protein